MSNFTIQPPPEPVIVLSLSEDTPGQVDVIARTAKDESWRIASFGNGKLHLFRVNWLIAGKMGLELDSLGYPLIDRA